MSKRHSVAIALIHLLVLASSPFINCVQIDNELVSKPHSCFERIAIGAMLPFEKTFRRSDTNQLDVCTNLCLSDPECLTFAFGISTRGNGTCQLSSQQIDSTGSSPAGTIFDPDFDLYARKTSNCLVDPGPPSHVPRPGGFEQQPGSNSPYSGSANLPPARPTSSSFPPTDGPKRPSPTVFVSPTSYTTDEGTTSGIYAQNAPSLHHPDRYYSHHPIDQQHYSVYPSGGSRYPDNGVAYNPNRKNGYQVTENAPDTPNGKPCFRRVLAGKRVASHWVRRTFVCERLEDCQQQCSEERRFSCEGFNYRIDPNGRGQGECELTEVPLAQMDLYSSPHNRDHNLIPHPDYDYYERDRMTSNCRPSCLDCGSNPNYIGGSNNRPPPSSLGYKPSGYESDRDRYRPEITAIDKYRPQNNLYETRPGSGGDSWDRYGGSNFFSSGTGGRPSHYPDSRPPPYGFMTSIDRYGVEDNSPDYFKPPYRPSSSGGYVDSGDFGYPTPHQKPSYERPSPSYERPNPPPYERPHSPPSFERPQPPISYERPQPLPVKPISNETPNYNRPLPPPVGKPDYDRPDPPYQGTHKPDPIPAQSGYGGGSSISSSSASSSHHHESPPPRPGLGNSHYLEREPHPPPPGNYHPTNFHQKPSAGFVPYLIGRDNSYGNNYGSVSYRPQVDYWGLKNEIKRVDGPHQFNYFELGPHDDNLIYGGRYGSSHPPPQPPSQAHSYGMNWGTMWTRRPGMEECSAKTSEGFRLHKGVVRTAMTAASVKECEKMCYSEDKFRCSVYSYRYSEPMRDNCLLCDRSFSLLDTYADFVPDRNYDIYSMSDDMNVCKKDQNSGPPTNGAISTYGDSSSSSSSNDQCFIRTIDHKRFFQAIVRDSLNVRSIKDCEIECIKTQKFTCRSFTFRYGSKTSGTIIDNCQLSDWPVRDMDHDRHLIPDDGFDVFERASYGRGCEIVPHEHNHQNPKLCYLGYGSAAKLLSSAIKKIISVTSEVECKNECIRYRETSPFKCLSFSFGSQASTFNCEMSDLDQSELKLDVHYTHTPNRDFWLFAWNPWDYTCRDKITSISSSNRANSDRRLDIFREPGGISTWQRYTVSGKPCRLGTKCEKNHIAGFYSCEIEGGEIGSWDFCCREDHPCGFSRDFDYPWCFVGTEKEQWRSCSVSYVPIQTQQYVGAFSTNSFVATKFPNKKHDIYHQSPPRPGGFSRDLSTFETQLHPLQYLYFDGPPNSTEISSNVIDCNRDLC